MMLGFNHTYNLELNTLRGFTRFLPGTWYVCFGCQKTREEQKIGLKIRLFGFLSSYDRVRDKAAHKVVSSLPPTGPFKIWVHAQIQQPLVLMLKFKPVLWVVLRVTKTSLVVKEMRAHAW